MLSVQTSKSSLEAACYEASNIPTHFYVPNIQKKKGGGSAHPLMSFSPPFPCYSSSCAPKLQTPFLIHDLFYNYWSPPPATNTVVTSKWEVRMNDDFFFKLCLFLIYVWVCSPEWGTMETRGLTSWSNEEQTVVSLKMLSLQIFYYFVIVFILLIRSVILSHSACLSKMLVDFFFFIFDITKGWGDGSLYKNIWYTSVRTWVQYSAQRIRKRC